VEDVSDTSAADAAGRTAHPARQAPVRRRIAMLAVLLAACTVAYALLLVRFEVSTAPVEAEFGVPAAEAGIGLYLQPVEIDPADDSMEMRVSVTPAAAGAAAVADRDVLVQVGRGTQIEHVRIRAGEPLPEVTYTFDLDEGEVRDYPLDRYVSAITLAAVEGDGAGQSLPIHVTAWEGLLGYVVTAQAGPEAGTPQLQFSIRRSGAAAVFGIAIYGAMAVMALCALVIGGLVFIGVRRIEVTLAGALGAVIFALPALRSALPGAPPLGVRLDILVFFWAEIGAIIAFFLFVAAWARRGPPP